MKDVSGHEVTFQVHGQITFQVWEQVSGLVWDRCSSHVLHPVEECVWDLETLVLQELGGMYPPSSTQFQEQFR